MFTKALEKTTQGYFCSRNTELVPYTIAEEKLHVHYRSNSLKEIFHNALSHLVSTNQEESNDPFKIYILPSLDISSSDDMIKVRKTLLKKVFRDNGLDKGYNNAEETYSICLNDFFYFTNIRYKFVLYVLNTSKKINLYHYVSPLQSLFHSIFIFLNKQVAHAGAVSDKNTGVLFTGASGSGKTTTTLHALREKYSYIAEDYCVLEKHKDELVAYSLYNSIKLTDQTYDQFDEFKDAASLHIGEGFKPKRAFFLQKENIFSIEKKVKIRAIINLSISDANHPILCHQTIQDSFKALGICTIRQNPIFSNRCMRNFASYMNCADLYHLKLSNNDKANISIISEILS